MYICIYVFLYLCVNYSYTMLHDINVYVYINGGFSRKITDK